MRTLLLALLLISSALAKPVPDTTIAQAAAHLDRLLARDLKLAELTAKPLVDDATFLRRAYLGIIGRIPSSDEAREFLDQSSPTKRAKLIDRLVASPGFDSHLFNWTADLLRVQTRQEQFGLGWHVWLRQSLAEDKPWDSIVSEMLGAKGHCSTDPAVGYYLRDRNMQLDNFSNTMQVFLGRQIGCAQCHDHPFDDWTQYEYYQMAAFGGGIQYRSAEAQGTIRNTVRHLIENQPNKRANKRPSASFAPNRKRGKANNKTRQLARLFQPLFRGFNKNAIIDNPDATLRLPQDYKYKDGKPGEIIAPETLFGEKLVNIAPENRRESFAAWLTSPENPYFTKVIANRLWARTFGHGLVDPIDDWDSDSESSHPEVLSYLETTIKGVDYDLRQFLRILYRTQLFQRQCLDQQPAMGMPLAFRGPSLTRMSAEQIHDSFLVLIRGQADDSNNSKLGRSWDLYRQQVAKLLDAEPQDLLILAESAKQGLDLQRKAQIETRAARKALTEATNPSERRKAQARIRKARESLTSARKQADPLRSMQIRNKRGKGGAPLRASELPAPFSPGTLIRQFGGSDREAPSSSDATATVPQALALLNDPRTDIIGGRKSQLSSALIRLDSPQQRLDHLFITLFARYPNAEESKRFTPYADEPKAIRDLTRAMLTSNRFLFIQ